MEPITIVLLGIALGAVFLFYRPSQTTAVAVAPENQTPIPEDGLTAIEYFWRPG